MLWLVGKLDFMLICFIFVFQNLILVLIRMIKEVDVREKELIYQVYREMLVRFLEQVKNFIFVLISGIKIFIIVKDLGECYLDKVLGKIWCGQ